MVNSMRARLPGVKGSGFSRLFGIFRGRVRLGQAADIHHVNRGWVRIRIGIIVGINVDQLTTKSESVPVVDTESMA